MIAPSADTAAPPRIRRVPATPPSIEPEQTAAAEAPATTPVITRIEPAATIVADPGPGRLALRQERRLARRQRRIAAALGLAVLAAFAGATVAVLGVVR
jgi:hypothetical protein